MKLGRQLILCDQMRSLIVAQAHANAEVCEVVSLEQEIAFMTRLDVIPRLLGPFVYFCPFETGDKKQYLTTFIFLLDKYRTLK